MSPQLENEKRNPESVSIVGTIRRGVNESPSFDFEDENCERLYQRFDNGQRVRVSHLIDPITIEEARDEYQNMGEAWRSNYIAFEDDGRILIDGLLSPDDLRRLADLWDACHDEEGNER